MRQEVSQKGRKVTPALSRRRGGDRAPWISVDPGDRKRYQFTV